MTKGFVKPFKPGPISNEEMYEKLKKGRGVTRTCDRWELWGYPEEVNEDAVKRRTSRFNKWLEEEHGLIWESTSNDRLYPADEIRDYRPKKKDT
jgi:hypothetical protein